ncbi:16S rRNA (guanine(966)-N(2))-methyltransferase RsmD [Vagococcus carniphilus]|uniref:16S rRNA (Guanine(966)-N(2))-methyltransferase RsmD n=1 Tax=Vagococcus carniphilus TaxID=218144 RepID=A0A430B831_9ENTE|nr:16S rRNA (guanine(966)-N(2))-methyltransferase RsmD [Vagococcus carniphilus]QNN74289.1 16S rRNA (guanine(966)-N(2))-methyltransferase RsmD [Vagococcus carniphilus]RSU16407.1 16S rRNA (guanine(966)-N(2))-methyltransferase RsmD [Vagococcus carniphilus]
MRVIAGDFKGRKLNSLSGDNTRPTSDKIKGSIFNMIGPYFEDEVVLDLFSGSGNLAIEAVSRGCEKAYCFDNHFKAISIIKENIGLTKKSEAFTVKKMDADKALDWLKGEGIRFDLVFLDPPYAKQVIEKQVEKMLSLGLLNEFAKVVCETDKQVELPERILNLEQIKVQDYGTTKVTIYKLLEGVGLDES